MLSPQQSISAWSRVMQLFATISIAWTLLSILALPLGLGFKLVFETDAGVVTYGAGDFTLSQRLVISFIGSIQGFCWLWMLAQVLRLSFCFIKGDILSHRVVNCLRYFGYGLFALAFSEITCLPLINFYLQSLGKLSPPLSTSILSLGDGAVESLMAGSLVIIISMILESSLLMRDELELTV